MVQIPVDVATFLLNEKRDDIRTIELRHKVNIVLIPNIHLETPAHEIVRLRHDQLNLEDQVLPSYKMVEAPPTEAYQPPSAQTRTAQPSRGRRQGHHAFTAGARGRAENHDSANPGRPARRSGTAGHHR